MKNKARPAVVPPPPKPFGPVPSLRQRKGQALEFYGFIHFTVNTFTGKEWGYGDEAPDVFAPSDFNADQIADTAARGGMKGLILTCKHHDGFCLWPSRHTGHSVRNSAWRNGRGDIVRDLARACADHDIRFGVYLSPWDRNRADYGQPSYLTYYRKQLRELLTEYGPLFEIWFDGANGGDGYYGGAREMRKIDPKTYYEWKKTWQLVRKLQPEACLFSDAGPDIRWIGNENGIAGDPCWQTIHTGDSAPGAADIALLNAGERSGDIWRPGECDVSIRPGWFYHTEEDAKVRTPENLLDLYFQSVGRGAALLLNLPPDKRGQIHPQDRKSLLGFQRRHRQIFSKDLARTARVESAPVRGGHERYGAHHLTDGDADTYWATDDSVTQAEAILKLPRPVTFNIVGLREALPLGQRVERFAVDTFQDGQWIEFASGTSIGNRRLLRGPDVRTRRIRLRVSGTGVCPALSEFSLYRDRHASDPVQA